MLQGMLFRPRLPRFPLYPFQSLISHCLCSAPDIQVPLSQNRSVKLIELARMRTHLQRLRSIIDLQLIGAIVLLLQEPHY